MIRQFSIITLTMLIAMATTGCTRAETAQQHILWQINGQNNTVYLLGSVHLLRKEDYPLPGIYNTVYADAEQLVMELDMDALDPVAVQKLMLTAGMISDGRSLQDILGDERWQEATDAANRLDISLAMLNATEPWLAALTIVELQMTKLGFDSSLGIEYHFVDRARIDNKAIEGLETIEEQIDVFDTLPLEAQSRFLLKTLEDAHSIEKGIDALIGAWRAGDIEVLHEELLKGFADFPAVYDSLVVKRNRAWMDDIEKMLADEDDYLIIVGALHLVGKDSVIQLLKDKGYKISQL